MSGGTARGIELRMPAGGRTRPTAARLREALFNILEAADADFTRVLDLYAGSGALGIEALSRGAEECVFVEADARACAVARENVGRAGVEARARVVRDRVGRWHDAVGSGVTLVLADPPYDEPAAWDEIERSLAGALAEHAVIVVEHAARSAPRAELAGRPLWRDRRQGDGAVAIYRAPATDEEE